MRCSRWSRRFCVCSNRSCARCARRPSGFCDCNCCTRCCKRSMRVCRSVLWRDSMSRCRSCTICCRCWMRCSRCCARVSICSCSRRSRAHSGRCARARWCGDARLGVSRHGRSLRRRGTMDLGSWRCNARRGRSRRCGDTRCRMRCHGRTLRRGSRTERRRGGSRHGRRRRRSGHRRWCRWTGHGRWWSRWSGCWRSRAAWAAPPGPPLRSWADEPVLTVIAETPRKSAAMRTPRGSMISTPSCFVARKRQRASAEIVRLGL